MGQFFERVMVQEKDMMLLGALVKKAMEEIGYTPGEEGKGVSVSYRQMPDSEWFDFSSPLLEQMSEIAEPLKKALSKVFRTPLLDLICVDSDFVLCRLIDETNGKDTAACINEPYEDLGFGEPDYTAWAAAAKKKWKCKPEQFKAVFEDRYTFAEDGIESLAKLLHFAPVDEVDPHSFMQATDWFLPKQEENETTRLHTLAEKLADYMEREYAGKLEAAGFRRYKNSPVRWHKVVGEPGNEVLLSMVFTTYRGFELAPFYGAQSLYCPLTLSDKYYPMHDANEYWREAQFEFFWKFGWSPLRIPGNPETNGWDKVLSFNEPEQLRPFIDELMLPELDEVTDLSSCRAYCLTPRKRERVLHENTPKTRVWIEAALDGDEAEAQLWYEHEKAKADRISALGRNADPWNRELLNAYESGGREGLIGYLRDTVYRDNMKKLKRAGIV